MRTCLFIIMLLSVGLLLAANLTVDDFIVDRVTLEDGSEVVGIIAPMPKPDFTMPEAIPTRASVMLPNVPALDWAYGCSATSAAMYAGHFDRIGLSNIYTGPTNGGVFPLPTTGVNYWGYDGQGNYQCPLSATKGGIDGQVGTVHVDDYWVAYGNSGDDPIGADANWPGHTLADCTGDFMGTNQDYWNNSDGSTTFYNSSSGGKLYDYSGAESDSLRRRDGAHGFRLFLENRGYEVYTNYNQYILGYNGNTSGITFADYKALIDAGHPVLIHVAGHTMLGVGYDDATSTVYLHDTWDFTSHSMVWGGSYNGMAHYGASVFITENTNYVAAPCTEDFEGGYPDADWRLLQNTRYNTCDFTATAASTGSLGLEMTIGNTYGYDTSGSITLPNMWIKAQPGGANEDFSQWADFNVDLSGVLQPWLQFDKKLTYAGASYYNNMWILVEDNTGTWHEVYASQISSTGFVTDYADLTPYAGQNVRLRFFHNGLSSYPCCIDNVSVIETASAPTVSATVAPHGILWHRAETGGTIANDNGMPIAQRGVCWAPFPTDPSIANNTAYETVNGWFTGDYDITMVNLVPGMTYNVRAYATNGLGVGYGPMQSFSTPVVPAEGTGTAAVADGDVFIPEVAVDFTFVGVAGASGADLTVDDLGTPPTSPGAAFLATTNRGDFSVVVTNNTGFTFANAEMRFDVNDLAALSGGGIDVSYLNTLNDGVASGIVIWRRSDYGTGDFAILGDLLYHSANGIHDDGDDYLYIAVNSFSEFAFSSDVHTLPVTLSSFNAVTTSEGAVQLNWTTQSESELAGYNLYRNIANVQAEALLLTPDPLTANNQGGEQSYSFTDVDVTETSTYWYWLEGVEMDGSTALYGPAQVTVITEGGGGDVPEPELFTALQGNYPNPFNPSTTVHYTLAEEAGVRLAVYNLRGQRVRQLDEGMRAAGEHRVVWDGRDANGNPVGSGVYLFRLETGDQIHMRKGILMK